MAKTPKGPLRGEDAWLAAKAAIAKRNDAARARGAEVHAVNEARLADRRREAEVLEARSIPQPQGR